MLNTLNRKLITLKPQVKLFTPGPLNVTDNVRKAMQYDYGAQHSDFKQMVLEIKQKLISIAGVSSEEYCAVLMEGSGTYCVEAVLGTCIARNSERFLILSNGAYGERQCKICEYYKIPYKVLRYSDDQAVNPEDVYLALKESPKVTHVSTVHSETTTGLLNPIEEIGQAIHEHNPEIVYAVDAMSSFGGVPIDLEKSGCSYLVSSSNKLLQGVPGFAFALCKLDKLTKSKANARSSCLDLYEQFTQQQAGEFRFDPPTHTLAGFLEALKEHEEEGGVAARYHRYRTNQSILSEEMTKLGFELYVSPEIQGVAITTFLQPKHPNFDFWKFYNYLASQNLVIYPGKLSKAPSFRLGSIGDLHSQDMHYLVDKVKEAFEEMDVPLPLSNY